MGTQIIVMKLIYFFQFVCVLLCSFGCKENVKDLNYCFIHETDQSFVNTDKSDMVQFEKDKLKRASLIKKNFKDLICFSESFGFPFVEPNTSVLDSCKYWAVTMTMIHAAQVQPEGFFSEKNTKLFKRELEKGNIRIKLLEQSVIIMVKTKDLCKAMESKIKYALNLWGLESALINDAKFINC